MVLLFRFVKCLNRKNNTASHNFLPSMQPRVCLLQWSDFADRMCQLPLTQLPQLDRRKDREYLPGNYKKLPTKNAVQNGGSETLPVGRKVEA